MIPSSSPSAHEARSKKRRGATAIEYVFCASLILVGCIVGVQSLSGMLKKSTSSTSEAIGKTVSGKK